MATPSQNDPAPQPAHVERLSVPVSWWIAAGVAAAVLWVTIVGALSTPISTAIALGGFGLMAWGLTSYGSVRVVVGLEPGVIRAGRAAIDARFLRSAEALDTEGTRRVAGVDADPRAFLVLRSYCRGSVRISLDDPDDPAPYWLVSSRRPETLAAAVNRAIDDRAADGHR